MPTADDDLVASLLLRIERLEDERAVHDTLVRYGLAVDRGDADGTAALYADDCHIDIDGVAFMDGRAEARGIVTSDAHQAILPGCAHLIGPCVVDVDGTQATATGYQTVYVTGDDGIGVWRQSFGRWELEKRDATWEIVRRTSRRVGHPEAQALFDPR